MNGVIHRARLYTALVGHSFQWSANTAYRVVKREEHPMGWTAYQDWSIGFMRTLFQIGGYNHWRNSIKFMMHMGNYCDKHMVITPVPPSTFQQPGCRNSWMISLKPEQQPPNPKASFVLMYLHGGAFVAGDPLMYKPAYLTWMQQLAAHGIHMRVFAVGYPLAPEHTFPAALHGVTEAYQWLVQELGGSDNIIIAGDSAGGNLTLATLAYMRHHLRSSSSNASSNNLVAADAESSAQPAVQSTASVVGTFHPPRAAILISPAVDFSSSSVFTKNSFSTSHSPDISSSDSNTSSNFKWDYISVHENVDVTQLYISSHNPRELSDPLVSPTYLEDFSGLVQNGMLVVAGGCEAMTPDIRTFVDKVRTASLEVAINYHEEPNEPHCYCVLGSMHHLVVKGAKVLVPFMEKMMTE
eukprot:GHUV01004763.1.p1 GENE.GHUV01004763.1~~GHUV01004763.1.p1  ORF type:complete len:411 (+),score=112.86 GHUV01004763.1:860-2092(+)